MKPSNEESFTLAFLSKPDCWPNWPYCPLKKRKETFGGLPKTGVVRSDQPTTVYVNANLWHLPKGKEEWEKLEHKTYGTLSELAADGWVVD